MGDVNEPTASDLYDVSSWVIVFDGQHGFIGREIVAEGDHVTDDEHVVLDPVFEYHSDLILQPGDQPGTVSTMRQRILVPIEQCPSFTGSVRVRRGVQYRVDAFDKYDIEVFQKAVNAACNMREQLGRQRSAQRANLAVVSSIPKGLRPPGTGH